MPVASKSKSAKVHALRIPKLVREKNSPEKRVCPSKFLAEMSLTTEEKLKQTYEMRIPKIIDLLDMSEMTHQKVSTVDIEEPLFQPYPSEIVFQNFEACNVYKVPLRLRNIDKVARMVKITQDDSPYFSILSPTDIGHKVAPGMDTIFHIQFFPDQKKDYNHKVVCITDREKFLIPVRAIGARGILDFSDNIHLGLSPVKYETSKTIFVRNIGNATAKFNLFTEEPFTLVPNKGVLKVGQSTQIEVLFHPKSNGSYSSSMIVQYETGEKVYVGLFGDANDINVRLDKSTMRLDTTYMTSASRRSFFIQNRSDIIVKFSWKQYATVLEEHQQKQRLCESLKEHESKEAIYDHDEFDPAERDKQSLLSQALKNTLNIISDENLLFEDATFVMDPLEGEIWPNSSTEVTVTFKPQEPRVYQSTIYCDVSGREARLPLKISGVGIGPKIQFSFHTLDIDNVFVKSKHSYEVVMVNKSDIDARFMYTPSNTIVGKQFQFLPMEGLVKAGEYHTVEILFSSPHLGHFCETFHWIVDGSNETFHFTIRGCVIGPTFHFDVPKLDFGYVSYGFTSEKTCTLVNTSMVQMAYKLSIPTDGHGLEASKIISCLDTSTYSTGDYVRGSQPLKEFELNPASGVLEPHSEVDVMISFTPLNVVRYETLLTVAVEDVGEDILTLSVFASCNLPMVEVLSPNVDLGRCFLRHEYKFVVQLCNNSNYLAKYEVVPQTEDDYSVVSYYTPSPRGIIECQSVINVPIHITFSSVQHFTEVIHFVIFGCNRQPMVFIEAQGEGPVIHLGAQHVDFGTIPVLTDVANYLSVSNESLIPAQIRCEMVRPHSLFKVEPPSAIIGPESNIQLKITANVNDNIRFQDKLEIDVSHSQMLTVHLTAHGCGSTIIIEPKFSPVWNLGPHLSSRAYSQKFRFYNRGRRSQQVYWLTEGFSVSKSRRKQEYLSIDKKTQTKTTYVLPSCPVFKLTPDRLSLAPGRYQDVLLEGYTDIPQQVKERMICQSIVGHSTGKEKIMTVDIIATFIQPLLEFSHKNVHFSVLKFPEGTLNIESKELTVKNVSLLPLHCTLRTQYPFLIKSPIGKISNSFEVFLEVDQSVELFIRFDPNSNQDTKSWMVESQLKVIYRDHPSTDFVLLKGEVFSPNLMFELDYVDFGTVLNDTEHIRTIKITNISPIDVHYTWSFRDYDISFEGKDTDEGLGQELSDMSSDEEKTPLKPHSMMEVSHRTEVLRPSTSLPCCKKHLFYDRPSTAPQVSFAGESQTNITLDEIKAPQVNVGIQEVFDILPLYGCLKPSESQQVQFSFYAHSYIMAEVSAACSVNGGPDYQVKISGKASLVQYKFSAVDVDMGDVIYDQFHTHEIQLRNTGKVKFEYDILPVAIPNPALLHFTPKKEKYVEAGDVATISLDFRPGIPEMFHVEIQIQVAHFPAETVTVHGVGVFPRVALNLMKEDTTAYYQQLFQEAQRNLELHNIPYTNGDDSLKSEVNYWEIQAEIERLEVKQQVLEIAQQTVNHNQSNLSKNARRFKQRVYLTEYVLDFGYTILGNVSKQHFQILNSGSVPVTFAADLRVLQGTGFILDLDRVKSFPVNECLDVEISYTPKSPDLFTGPLAVNLPIKISGGPVVQLCLKAYVEIPNIRLSVDSLLFNEVVCGQCKVVTVQIENISHVPCEWNYCVPQIDTKQSLKHVPLHIRKKMKKQPAKLKIFEVSPSSGCLLPTQKLNIQVKFMPTEEIIYNEKLSFKIANSSFKHFIACKGNGLEPHIILENNTAIFQPVLPYLGRDQTIIKVTNPCKFPIEFYSLEFDKQYLGEEKLLRELHGYDEYNSLLLPPRVPGESFPKQLLPQPEKLNQKSNEVIFSGDGGVDVSTKEDVTDTLNQGELEVTPVAAAIASYLGIDLSSEGRSALNRRGIFIILHGSPLSGKTATAVGLSGLFQASHVCIDDVVLDALKNGTSSAACRTRELCKGAAKVAKSSMIPIEMTVTDDDLPPIKQRRPSQNPTNKIKPVAAIKPMDNEHTSKKLELTCDMLDEGEELYTCVLPEDLLVELLAERFQQSACHVGVVVDGLDSAFTRNVLTTGTCVLRAANNRKHIYAVTLELEHATLKEYNVKKQADKELAQQLADQDEWMRLEEMSEDEYDSLSQEEREAIDHKRLVAKQEVMRKKKELKEEKMRLQRECEMMEERRIEEEKNLKKRKKAAGKIKEKKSMDKLHCVREGTSASNNPDQISLATSMISESSVNVEDMERKKPGSKNVRKRSEMMKDYAMPVNDINECVEDTPEERELKAKFRSYVQSSPDVKRLFQCWDRTTGWTNEPVEGEVDISVVQSASVIASKKTERKKGAEKDRLKEIVEVPALPSINIDNGEEKPSCCVPNIILQTEEPQSSLLNEVIEANVLPDVESVLEDVGLGASGPPLPPDTVFDIIIRPPVRQPPFVDKQKFSFLPMATDDEVQLNTTKSRLETGGSDKPSLIDKKDSKKQTKNRLDRTPSTTVSKKGRQCGKPDTPPANGLSPDKESVSLWDENTCNRWVIASQETIEIKLSFKSDEVGLFDQTLNFEIRGTLRKYQLFCRGICTFPNITTDPKIVFPQRKKFQRPGEIVHKKFILNTQVFEFGPLLAGKNRERYRDGRFPENMTKFWISNTSPMHADISFSFLNDNNATTFLLEPPTMSLKPGDNMPLFVWAYPKTPGDYEDTIVCCIKDNPVPAMFRVNANGARPELELDRKVVQFDRVILHRKETQIIYLRNSTLVPVAWKLSGMDALGDDFSVSVDHGVIEPMNEFGLQMHFRAIKNVNVKKVVRLEVSDVDNVMGLSHAENINVLAEAYDIALDLSFPKGTDGGLEFGTIKVGEEVKQNCSLKNKGRYEIVYRFIFDEIENSPVSCNELFTIKPNKGTLAPNERPTQVLVTFKSNKEIDIKDQPILKCQLIEPKLGENGEVIANIPVKISVKSLYSRYHIYPSNDINFGAVIVNTRKTRTFVIENKGEFEFRFIISRVHMMATAVLSKLRPSGIQRAMSRQGSIQSDRSRIIFPGKSRRESVRGVEMPGFGNVGSQNTRLFLGMFTVYPISGLVASGASATITVDMLSEIAMVGQEDFTIEISERPPTDNPNGVEYRLIGEVCIPNILTLPAAISSVFEEHRIVKNLNIFACHSQILSANTGVYGEEDGKFFIYNVIVGHKAKMRFKITNPNKIPCDVFFSLKPLSNKPMHRITDVFDIEPTRAMIQAHSSVFATVAFQPNAMQQYSCIFDVMVEGLSGLALKSRNISFEIQGDGNLPRISVVKPMATNTNGNPVILFHRLLLGRSQSLIVVLKNVDNLPCKANIKLVDPNHCFIVCLKKNTFTDESKLLCLATTSTKPVSSNFNLPVNETCEFQVEFCPKIAGKVSANLHIMLEDNPFENLIIEFLGEGYIDEFTIDNIQMMTQSCFIEADAAPLDTQNIIIPSYNQITFGDCDVGVSKSTEFTITNHSSSECMRFQWNSPPEIVFTPNCGHLQANCAKDVIVTYTSQQVHKLQLSNVPCHVSKIVLPQATKKVTDWDDRRKVVCWVNEEHLPSDTQDVNEPARKYPAKKKVVQIVEEPTHTVISGSTMEVDLFFSANCNYAEFEMLCTNNIEYKDTFLFDTRVHSFKLKNVGSVALDYDWSVTDGCLDTSVEQIAIDEKVSAKNTLQPISLNSDRSKMYSTKKRAVTDQSIPSTKDQLDVHTSDRFKVQSSLNSLDTAMNIVHIAANQMTSSVDIVPFSIQPNQGNIMAGDEEEFTVRFSPLEVLDAYAILAAEIKNLNPSQIQPKISLHGKSLLSWCHFELEESSYITESRNPELKGAMGAAAGSSLDAKTKVLEFRACGINTKLTRRFFIINPTDTQYTFAWSLESSGDGPSYHMDSNFLCLTPKGVIKPGKKAEIVFEYQVTTLNLCESFWRFVVAEKNISVPFLLVGFGSEPSLSFDRSHVNFKQLLTGQTAKHDVYLLNDENVSFSFQFDESSCHMPGHTARIHVEPMKGVVQQKSRLAVTVSYKPDTEAEVNFNIICNVKKKKLPLMLNVKAEGFAINIDVQCTNSVGSKIRLLPKITNIINFGNVEINEKSLQNIFLENNGKFNVDFNWLICRPNSCSSNNPLVSITPENGSISPTVKRKCQLVFCPPHKISLKDCNAVLKITNGPTYRLSMVGHGCVPLLHFSFVSHDFGPCFIYRAGVPVQRKILLVTNKDSKEISFECQYAGKPHLEVNCAPTVLQPGHKREVEIKFYPRELKCYNERIPFEINGLSHCNVQITGEGTELRVEVLQRADRKVNLGVLQINEKSKKVVRIVNQSLSAIDFNCAITPTSMPLQMPGVLSITPSTLVHLPAKDTFDLVVSFQPKTRIPQFFEEVLLEFAGLSRPLFTVTGACHAMDIQLDCVAVPFGSVTLGSASSRKLVMNNYGDIGSSFSWNVENFQPIFDIHPERGYISPGMEVPFDINFRPTTVSHDIRYEDLRCTLEEGQHLNLVLTGSCVPQTPMKELVYFSAHVRNRDTKSITLQNKSNGVWNLRPIIDGEYWTGADSFIVDGQQSRNYELIYRPLTMTLDNKKHTGSVFFALPDGTGLLYNLAGTSDVPKPVSNIQRDVPCKVTFTELLHVSNWLSKPQRFRVSMELVKPEKLDPSTTFKGVEHLDVPGLSKKEYKVTFYAHKEGMYCIKVMFKNEVSGEYLFYYITFKVGMATTIGQIDLTTPVRQNVSHVITIQNPLLTMVNFQTSTTVQDVNMPSHFSLPPQSEGSFTFEYLPLNTSASTAGRLQLQSLELGVYIYDLNLNATSAAPERAVHFTTTIGASQVLACKFMNYARTRAEYLAKIDCPEFLVERSLTTASASSGGSEVSIDVTFEPCRLGNTETMLVLTSNIGGEYFIPLHGHCLPPKPQGPFTIRAGSSAQIPFKNIFSQTTSFAFHIDSPAFSVKPGEAIRAKKTHNLVISFDGNQGDSKAVRMSRLVITCARSAGSGCNLAWTYYLKGVTQ